jgi:hypothetical protein
LWIGESGIGGGGLTILDPLVLKPESEDRTSVGALDRVEVASVGALDLVDDEGRPEVFDSSWCLEVTASLEALIAALAFDNNAIPSEGGGRACSSPSSVQSENLLG